MNPTPQFPGYAYLLSIKDFAGIEHPLGGFAETTAPAKIQGIHKVTDVTMKRGIVNSGSLANWIQTQRSVRDATALSSITITERNELHQPIRIWSLNNAMLQKVTAPPLSAQSNEVAVQELVLIGEGISLWPPH